MAQFILSALLFVFAGGVSAHATEQIPPSQTQQELDLNKINQVLKDLGASLIQGDDLFTELSAEFNPEQTSLEKYKAELSASATVTKTVWSSEPSLVNMVGSVQKLGEFEKNGEKMVTLKPAVAAVLQTKVIPMLQYGLKLYGCELTEPSSDVQDPWTVLELEMCKVWNSKVPVLETSRDLNLLVAETLATAITSMDAYIARVEAELGGTQDQEKQELLKSYVDLGKKYLTRAKNWKLEAYQDGLANYISYELDTDFFGMGVKGAIFVNFSPVIAAPSLIVEVGVFKDSFEGFFAEIKSILFGLQNEDQETIDGAKSFLGEYLEIVKDMISEKN